MRKRKHGSRIAIEHDARTKGRAAASIQRRRLASACFIVALLLAVFPLGSAVGSQREGALQTSGEIPASFAADDLYDAVRSGTLDAFLASSGLEQVDPEALPDDSPVAQALTDIASVQEVWRVTGMDIAGAVLVSNAPTAFAEMTSSLEHAGWVAVPSGSQTSGSFVQEDGAVRWLFILCSQEGQTTTAVMQWHEGGDLEP